MSPALSKTTSVLGLVGWPTLVASEIVVYLLLVAFGRGLGAASGALVTIAICDLTLFGMGVFVARNHPGVLKASLSFGVGRSSVLEAYSSSDERSAHVRSRVSKLVKSWIVLGSVLQLPLLAFLAGLPGNWSTSSICGLFGMGSLVLGFTWSGVFRELGQARSSSP